MREDQAQLRMGQAPHVLAMLNNTAWGLLARNAHGLRNETHTRLKYLRRLFQCSNFFR